MYDGAAQDMGFCELAPGVIGTFEGILLVDGSGEIPIGGDDCSGSASIPWGTYHVKVMHGIDHEMFETDVTLMPEVPRVVVNAPLQRAWSPGAALAADLHVHTAESNDSRTPVWVRVISELTAGIQVIGASDHNYNGSFDAVIDAENLRGQIASIPGNEVSVDMLHANVFPIAVSSGAPGNGAPSYDALAGLGAHDLFARLHALPGAPIVQINHPRLRFAAYFDYAGWDGRSWPPPMPIDFDVIEVLTGMMAFRNVDDDRVEQALQDLYTFMRNGRLVAATGNSDTHHLSSVLAGIPRNYVFGVDPRLHPFDTRGFVDALRSRRVVVTTGPWLDVATGDGAGAGQLTTAEGGKVHLSVSLRQASFVKANRIRVWVGGELRQTLIVPDGTRALDWSADLDVGAADSWIGVDATGDQFIPSELTGDFLYWTAGAGVAPVAFINPILVDGDGDGAYTTAAPAKRGFEPDLLPPPPSLRRGPYECGMAPMLGPFAP